ncbi:MAG: hypothetical protein IKK30_00695 [Clostridia bacterium]|nr:hypothetical protein [Clostridia bacterium]
MKRVFSVLMICALLLAGLTSFAGAEGVPALAITVDQTAVEKGDTVTATVKASDYTNEAWSAMTVKVTYDPTYLSFNKETDVLSNAALEDIQTVVADVKNGVGTILINWISSDGVPAADYLVQLQFTALAETTNAVISAAFTEDGQALIGSSDPIENAGGSAFSSDVVSSGAIEIQPEEPDATKATITTTKEPANKVSFGVKGVYVSGGQTHKYMIDLSWTDMTYEFTAEKMWNPNDLKWEIVTEGAYWTEATPAEITFVNHSSEALTATAEYKAEVEKTAFTFGETADTATKETISVSLDACTEGTSLGNAPQKKIYAIFKPNGAVISDPTNPTPLGTIKVTIA